jgi:hypothetical protein
VPIHLVEDAGKGVQFRTVAIHEVEDGRSRGASGVRESGRGDLRCARRSRACLHPALLRTTVESRVERGGCWCTWSG